jgi:hypothetical protein
MHKIVCCLLCAILTGCYTQVDRSADYSASYMPHRAAPRFVSKTGPLVLPDTGFYYAYKFVSYDDEIRGVDLMLSDLYSRGFDILMAWYSAGGTRPPGKAIAMPSFTILLKTWSPELYRFNFEFVRTVASGAHETVPGAYVPEK